MHRRERIDACPEGIARQAVPDLCAANGIRHGVRRLSLAGAYRSEEANCTGTVGEPAGWSIWMAEPSAPVKSGE